MLDWKLECIGQFREIDEEGESRNVDDSEGADDKEEDSELPNPYKKTYNANHLPNKLFTAVFAFKAFTSQQKA